MAKGNNIEDGEKSKEKDCFLKKKGNLLERQPEGKTILISTKQYFLTYIRRTIWTNKKYIK